MNNEQLEKAKNIFFIILGVDILIVLIFGINSFQNAGIFQQIQAGTRVADQALISSIEFFDKIRLLPIISMIAVGYGLVRWLNACYKYADESIGVKKLQNRKWTILGWVIPIFNIFKPFQIINEIFKVGSKEYNTPTSWKNESSSTPLLLWWVIYFLAHFVLLKIGNDIVEKSSTPGINAKVWVSIFQEQIAIHAISLTTAILWFVIANYLTKRLIERTTISFVDAPNIQRANLVAPNGRRSETIDDTDEDQYFSQVAKEMVSGQRDEGLWAKAYALQEGDDKKTKAHYIRLRVEQLSKADVENRPTVQPTTQPMTESENKGGISPIVWVSVVVGSIIFIGIISAMTIPTRNKVTAEVQKPLAIEKEQVSEINLREIPESALIISTVKNLSQNGILTISVDNFSEDWVALSIKVTMVDSHQHVDVLNGKRLQPANSETYSAKISISPKTIFEQVEIPTKWNYSTDFIISNITLYGLENKK
jgi:hypothetical protein